MRRRDFLTVLAGVAAALRSTVGAAEQARLATIGVLVIGKPDPAPVLQGFREELQKLGYVEGRNIRIVVRSADGNLQRLPDLAAELAREPVDIVATWMTPAVLAAAKATGRIPIVMIGAADPVGMGIVKSLARPGANVTGMAGQTVELAGKIVELLKEMLPSIARLGALCNAADPFSNPFRQEIEAAGKANGVEVTPLMVTEGAPLDETFRDMNRARIDAIVAQPSLPLGHIAELALRHRIAAAAPLSPFAQLGGLMSYASDPQEGYRAAAVFVDKILKGASPADLPVEQPAKFSLVINLRTARALDVTVPPALLGRADEVIE